MGSAASFEMSKPVDANDILKSQSLPFAKSEVIRLRGCLGHLARLAGIDVVVYDASDIVLGMNDQEDFHRCVQEVSHIRQCLRLHTQVSRRRGRPITATEEKERDLTDAKESSYHNSRQSNTNESKSDDSSSDSDSS
jgi:hypothetical protein